MGYMYVQVIPLYLPDDEAAKRYFEEHHNTIDKITGEDVVVVWPKEVKAGDVAATKAGIKERFPSVKVSDLPCLVVESKDGSFFVPLLYADDQKLKAILRRITAVAGHYRDIGKLEGEINSLQEARPVTAEIPKWFPIAGFCCIVLAIVFLMAMIALDREIRDNNRMLVVFVLALTVAAAQAFLGGAAAANGQIPIPWIEESPVKFSITGGGAAFVIVLLLGYWTYARVPDDKKVTIRVSTDAPCSLRINGKSFGILTPGKNASSEAQIGDQAVVCESNEVPELVVRESREAKTSGNVSFQLNLAKQVAYAKRFAADGDIVHDKDTGFAWRRTDNGQDISVPDGERYCKGLGDGWDLPTWSDLQGLPFCDSAAAPDSQVSACRMSDKFKLTVKVYWSRQDVGGTRGMVMRLVDLATREAQTSAAGGATPFSRVLCVSKSVTPPTG
jgi:hypothetical protein